MATKSRKIIGTVFDTGFVNDRNRTAIKLEVDGKVITSRAESRSRLRSRLKGYGFTPEEILAAVPVIGK